MESNFEMDEQFKKDWEDYTSSNPSSTNVWYLAIDKKELAKPAWDYLKRSGKLNREDAVSYLVNFPEIKEDAMKYLGHFNKDEALRVAHANGPYLDKAYDAIKHDINSLKDVLHSGNPEVVNRAWKYARKKLSNDDLVDLMTYKSGIWDHDTLQEHAWNNFNPKRVSDSDLELIVLQAPKKYKKNAAEILYDRTRNPKLKEEMRQILVREGNTYLMTDEEKQDYYERRFRG